jgi:Fe-S oxidoreductase
MAKLKHEYLARRNLREGVPRRARLIASMPHLAAWASRTPRISNFLLQSGVIRGLSERRYGLDRRVPPPRFASRTFRSWYRNHSRTRTDRAAPRGELVYFVDTWTNYHTPQVGIAAVRLLEAAGYRVLCPETACCGRPAISGGLLAEARDAAVRNQRVLAPLARKGLPIVGTEPSCVSALIDEYPQLMPNTATQRIARQTSMIERFLARLIEEDPTALAFRPSDSRLLHHVHCHQKALDGDDDVRHLLAHVLGGSASIIGSGCCGMAGSFGHEVEHHDVARAIGEQRLFPAIRDRAGAEITVSGFSCRQQITHHTDAAPRHIIEVLAALLGETESSAD